ncbi:hypothetical protein MASR1M45_05000 [Candidatus Kapaibacterium sp.]
MTLQNLKSDARVEGIEFKNGYLHFYYEDYFNDKIYEVRIKTDLCYVNYKLDEIAYEFCHIRQYKLADHLPIDEKSKLYIMPEGFIKQMKVARQKYNLAIGLNSQEWKHFIQVYGDGLIIACPVKSLENIDIEEVGTIVNINPN